MKYLQPDYYDLFKCSAGACENTCCMGWKIAIDEESLSLYETMPGRFGDKVRKSVDWREECLLQKGNRCLLLDENGLCEIQKNCGHEALPASCREYPRHVEEFPEVREYSLSLSCPEAAEIILTGNSFYSEKTEVCGPGVVRVDLREPDMLTLDSSKYGSIRPGNISLCRIVEKETEEKDDIKYEDFDGKLYSFMLELRNWMREILSYPEISLRQKRISLRDAANCIQELLDQEYSDEKSSNEKSSNEKSSDEKCSDKEYSDEKCSVEEYPDEGYPVSEYSDIPYVSDEFLESARACLEKEKKRAAGTSSDECISFLESDDFEGMKKEFLLLEELYPIDSSWPEHRRQMYRLLYENGEEAYRRIQAEFEDILQGKPEDAAPCLQYKLEDLEDATPCLQYKLEDLEARLIDYYIYVYLAGAVYDGDIVSKINLALYSGHRLREAALFMWLKNNRSLTLSDIALSISRYAREIEHADENLEILMEGVDNLWQ